MIFEVFRGVSRFLIEQTYFKIDFGLVLLEYRVLYVEHASGWLRIIIMLEHKSFWLTSEPGNTGTPVGSDTVAVFWYIGFFIFGKVTFWDFLDMSNLNKLHVCSFLIIFDHIWSYLVRKINICGRDGAAGTDGRPGRTDGRPGRTDQLKPSLKWY